MDSYSLLLERIRVPQPSLQRFAVISIFEKLRSAPPYLDADSNPGTDAISQCLHSNSASVVDQSVRELCRLVNEGKMEYSRGFLELQSALEGTNSSFVDVFVKGIGFFVRFGFQKNKLSWNFDSPETHPFVKVLSCRTEVQTELVRQVILFVMQNKHMGIVEVCKFLRPFLNFSILRIPFSDSSSLFVRNLISTMASLSCSFPSEAMPIIKLLTGCLKYYPCKNAEDCRSLIYFAEYLVDAFMVVLRHVVANGLLIDEAQFYGVELLETLLSFLTDLNKHSVGSEPIIELSKRLLLAQKDLGLQYIPELLSATLSLFISFIQTELEHEQLSILKLSVFMLKWKSENEHASRDTCVLNEELLFIFPAIHIMSSPSKSVKAAASDLLFILEKLLLDLLVAQKNKPIIQGGFPSISKPESIICRLLQRLWFQDQPSLSSSFFLSFASTGKIENKEIHSEPRSWISQLTEYTLWTVDRKKSLPISQFQENLLTEKPFLLSAIVAVLVMHHSLGSSAVDSLTAIGVMDPKLGVSLLLAVLFYNKIFCSKESNFHEMLLKLLGMLPSLASHSMMVPLIVQTILPMLHKDAQPVLFATAIRLLCKTWETTDRVFGSLQGVLHPNGFTEFVSERTICISMAVSVCDVCRKNPDRGVDLILSVSACVESRDPTIQALGLQSLAHLCEADVVDFYTAWDVIAKHVVDYSVEPIVSHGTCILLRWGAMDAEAYSEASRNVLQILWAVGTSRHPDHGSVWVKARASAFEALTHYEVDHVQKSIPDFKKRNTEMLISEDNSDVLRAMEGFEDKIISFEHITRRRLLKEKRVLRNKIEKLLDVFPQVIFPSGKSNNARELPGAALLCLSFTPKDVHIQGTRKGLPELHAAYENALIEIAEALPLSRNILVALFSLQSWKPFMQRWMRAVIMFLDAQSAASTVLDKTSKAANDILKIMKRIAEESIPRSAENIALAVGALCTILPPSAHAVTSTASKFLLKWTFQYEHEHRQWSAAIALGLISNCLHATDRKQKVEIITGLLEVACSNKSTLVKGACGVGLGFTCQDLLTRVETDGDSNLLEETGRMREASLLGKIVRALSLMICQLSSSSSNSLESLCKYFPLGTDDMDTDTTFELSSKNFNNLEEDVWGVAGLIMGLGSSVSAIYRAGSHDVVLKIKALITSWIPHVNPLIYNSCICSENLEIPLSVGSCLALPIVVTFCQRVELMDGDELDHFVNGYRELISELISVKKSGIFHQSLLMASCIGAGTLLSGILDEGVHSIKAEYVKGLLELFRDSYTNPYPPIIHLGGMLGVVNALGAGAGTLNHLYHQSSLQTGYEQKESSYIRGPILSSPVCEQLSTSLMQEIFLVAQDSKEHQLQRYAAWAVSFLRHRWWSKELQTVKNSSQSDTIDSKHVSQSFPEDSIVWRLSLWLMDLNCSRGGSIAHVNTVTTILRCLSRAPRLPSLDWGAIIRRCMRYEAQGSEKLFPDSAVERGNLREQCILFSLAHANQFDPLLFFLDELSDLSRFRTLELNLQSCLLCHLAELIKIFSGSRQEKLFDDMADYLCSSASSYQVYNPDQQSLLQVSFWKGLYHCLEEASTESSEYISNMEKCMELLFTLLPALHSDASLSVDLANSVKEWSEAIKCLGKARRGWLMDLLEVPEVALVQGGGKFIEVVKRIQARARLVRIGYIPLSELGKLKAYILNTKSDGIWDVLVEVVAALQYAEGSIKRQWLADAVEISCITKYPSTTLQFLGLLSGSCCKYMPLLTLDRVTVLSDLPVTLTSLLSDRSWGLIAESVVMNLCASTKRIYNWATCLESGDDALSLRSIDESENRMAVFLTRMMHHVCVSLKDYLPLEKQLWLANMIVP